MKKLFQYLAEYKGKIVSTASLESWQIEQAKASDRMYVDENSLGFVWQPDTDKFPETVDGVKMFERWFPLEIELPESLKNMDWFYKQKFNPHNN